MKMWLSQPQTAIDVEHSNGSVYIVPLFLSLFLHIKFNIAYSFRASAIWIFNLAVDSWHFNKLPPIKIKNENEHRVSKCEK